MLSRAGWWLFGLTVLLLATSGGCMRRASTSPAVALQAIEKLGGRVEPPNPSPGHPVYRVSLNDTRVSDEHLRYLDAFPALRMLSLANTDITDDGLKYLKPMRNLKRLSLTNTLVTNQGLRELHEANPLLRIQR